MRDSVGDKWYDLGIELLKSNDVNKLNEIRDKHRSNFNRCTAMFFLWLERQPTASWNQLLEALRLDNIGLNTLAANIEKTLLQDEFQG